MEERHSHENPMQSVSTKFAIGTFLVIGLLAFLYIRFFSSYSSSTTGDSPTPAIQREAIVRQPVKLRLVTFTTPQNELSFEYPAEWFQHQEREGEWLISDAEATEEAKIRILVSETAAISSPEAELRCTSDCEELATITGHLPVKTVQNSNGTTSRIVAVPAGSKGYMITGTFDQSFSPGIPKVDSIFGTIGIEK